MKKALVAGILGLAVFSSALYAQEATKPETKPEGLIQANLIPSLDWKGFNDLTDDAKKLEWLEANKPNTLAYFGERGNWVRTKTTLQFKTKQITTMDQYLSAIDTNAKTMGVAEQDVLGIKVDVVTTVFRDYAKGEELAQKLTNADDKARALKTIYSRNGQFAKAMQAGIDSGDYRFAWSMAVRLSDKQSMFDNAYKTLVMTTPKNPKDVNEIVNSLVGVDWTGTTVTLDKVNDLFARAIAKCKAIAVDTTGDAKKSWEEVVGGLTFKLELVQESLKNAK